MAEAEDGDDLREAIRAEMDRRGHLQQDAAEAMGCSPGTLGCWLRDRRRNLTWASCCKVAGYIGWDPQRVWDANRQDSTSGLVTPDQMDELGYPVRTAAGTVTRRPLAREKFRSCTTCEHLDECWLATNSGGSPFCCWILEGELLPQELEEDSC